MDYAGRYVEFFSCTGTFDFTIDFKLHVTLYDDNQLIGTVHETFPALPRRIDPQGTTKSPGCPVFRDRFLVYCRHGLSTPRPSSSEPAD